MATGRERAVAAAVDLLAVEGTRGLTHLRVDAAAGLPRGSTSNYFRTRDALYCAVLDGLLDRDLAYWAEAAPPTPPRTVTDLADILTRYVRWATTIGRSATAARYAVVADPALPAAARDRLGQARTRLRDEVGALLAAVAPDGPAGSGDTLLAAVDGVLLHAITARPAPDSADPSSVADAVRALVVGLAAPPR